MKRLVIVIAAALALSGCAGAVDMAKETLGMTPTASAPTEPATAPAATETSASPTPTPQAKDATELAEAVKQPSTTKVVTITEDNDPNNLIGRPNGYVSAAVLYESSVKCDDLGADCGATIEVFASPEEAQARSDYIQAMLKEAPVLGSEYNTVVGPALLRVSGKVKPSVATQYADAFNLSAPTS